MKYSILLKSYLFLFHVYGCSASTLVYVLCVCSIHRGQKMVSDVLELDLQMVVNSHMDVGN